MKFIPAWLKKLRVTRVSLVDKPANPAADVVLFKNQEPVEAKMTICRRCGETNTRGKCSRCDNLDMEKVNKTLDFLELSYDVKKGEPYIADIVKRLELSLGRQDWFVYKGDVQKLVEQRADRILELGLATNRDAAWAKAMSETVNPYLPRSADNPRLGDLWTEAPDDEHTAQRDRRRREQARQDGEKLSERARALQTRRKAQGVEMTHAAAMLEVAKTDTDFKHEYNLRSRE